VTRRVVLAIALTYLVVTMVLVLWSYAGIDGYFGDRTWGCDPLRYARNWRSC
jgi:hypothetical protein